MPVASTLILLPQTTYTGPGPYTVVGETHPAAAYYVSNKDLQTLNYKLTGLTGNLVIEASLATLPTTSDWFTVFELVNVNSTVSSYINIVGKFVYIRAKIDNYTTGIVDHIKLTY